ncbi:MAG: MBL fold metallo-hydrolase [Bacteroidales bacterium]|nr:MBL fold metallo-hydrolase [Bacteroidales bacterium]
MVQISILIDNNSNSGQLKADYLDNDTKGVVNNSNCVLLSDNSIVYEPNDELKISKNELLKEHGLSIFINKDDKEHFIIDMGASNKYRFNALKMNIDLSTIDFAVVSHGHSDHIGGLSDFLENFKGLPVYLSKEIASHNYFSTRHNNILKNIGNSHDIINDNADRIKQIDANCFISNDVALIFNKFNSYSKPHANKYLYSNSCLNNKKTNYDNGFSVNDSELSLDSFNHEITIAIIDNDSLIIVSPCSHNGIINIINSCIDFTGIKKIKAFIGGLHLIDDDSLETKKNIENLSKTLNSLYPDLSLFTGHCTGENAFQILNNCKSTINIENLFSGKTFSID